MAAMLPGGGAFLERLERRGLIGVVGEGEENSEASDGGLLRFDAGDGGTALSPSKLYAID